MTSLYRIHNWRRSLMVQHALMTYGTQLLVAVFGLGSSVIIARALGPAGRGQYAVALALGLIGVQLGNLGLHSSNSYFLVKDRTQLPRLIGNSLLASFVLGGVAAAGLAAGFQFWADAPLHGTLLWLAALWVPCGLAYLLLVNLFMGLFQVKLYNLMELVNRALSLALVIAALWLLGARRPEPVFAAALLGVALSFLIAFWMLRRFCEAPVSFSSELFRQNFKFGWKAYLSCFFAFLVIRIDLLMVRSMLGAAPAGYYSIAGTIGDYILLLPAAVGAILFPKLSAMSDDRQKWAITWQAVFATGGGLMALLLLLGFASKYVIAILFGNAFAPAVPAFLLLMPGILFLGLEVVLVQYLNSRGFPLSVVMMWVVVMATNVLLNLWAIPKFGINGAAAVSSVSYLLALGGIAGIIWKGRRLHLAPHGDMVPELDHATDSLTAGKTV